MYLFEQVGKPLAALSQSAPVKDVIQKTINRTLEAIIFVTDRSKNGHLAVAAAPAHIGYQAIIDSCNIDTHYVDELAKVVYVSFTF